MYNEKISLFLFRPRNKSNNFLFPNTDILIPNIIPRDLTPISIICIEKSLKQTIHIDYGGHLGKFSKNLSP